MNWPKKFNKEAEFGGIFVLKMRIMTSMKIPVRKLLIPATKGLSIRFLKPFRIKEKDDSV